MRPQRQVNHLNGCRDRRIGHRLKLSLQAFSKGLSSLRVREGDTPRSDQRGRRSRNSHHPFGHPPQRLVCGIEGL
jgi:hypothetical protein